MNEKLGAPRPTEFDKLLRFIVTFQGRFALAFICGEDRRQRQGVLASLADLLREKGLLAAFGGIKGALTDPFPFPAVTHTAP